MVEEKRDAVREGFRYRIVREYGEIQSGENTQVESYCQ